MIIGLLHLSKKSHRAGRCALCKGTIDVGDLHNIVYTVYGKAQQRIREVRQLSEAGKRGQYEEPTGRVIGRREGLQYVRLHVVCLTNWQLAYGVQVSEWRRTHRKGGRPKGTGMLAELSEDEKLVRRRLVRRRADLLRRILNETERRKLASLYRILLDVDGKLGGEKSMVVGMIRRSRESLKVLNMKLTEAARAYRDA